MIRQQSYWRGIAPGRSGSIEGLTTAAKVTAKARSKHGPHGGEELSTSYYSGISQADAVPISRMQKHLDDRARNWQLKQHVIRHDRHPRNGILTLGLH